MKWASLRFYVNRFISPTIISFPFRTWRKQDCVLRQNQRQADVYAGEHTNIQDSLPEKLQTLTIQLNTWSKHDNANNSVFFLTHISN